MFEKIQSLIAEELDVNIDDVTPGASILDDLGAD